MMFILKYIFLLLVLVSSGFVFADAFADVTVVPVTGSGAPGCEETSSGCYSPSEILIIKGETVTWKNTDSAAHTATSVSGGSPTDVFDSGLLMAGNSFSHKFTDSGRYDYLCMVHPWMTGVVVVADIEAEEEPVYVPPTPQPTQYPPSSSSADVKVARDSASPGCERYNSCYSPSTITITEGSSLSWYNADAAAHTVTSGTAGRGSDGEFDSGLFMAGNYFSTTFDNDGIFPYFCAVHPWMEGTVIVEAIPEPVYVPPTIPSTPTPQQTYPGPAPYGTNVEISRDTAVPGCEETRSCYDPYRITAGKYSTITWYNADAAFHTVTSGSASNGPDGEFGSGMMGPGDSFSFRFTDDGTFNYFCMIHPWMEGQIVISRGGESISPPSTSPSVTTDTTPPKILKPSNIVADADDHKGVRVNFDVLGIDETDEIVRPSCNPSSGALFGIGTTSVTCNAIDSSGNRASAVSFSITVNPPQISIPNWVKNVAEFWCSDKIEDGSFIEGIQYLIDNDIIIVSTSSSGSGSSQGIPDWVKNNACWWSEGLISDTDFAAGIEFLVKEGIIRV
jgi:plastocyanin